MEPPYSLNQNHQNARLWDSVFPLPALPSLLSSVIVFLVAVLIFSNSVQGNFVFDDSEAVVNNQDVQLDSPLYKILFNDFWGTPLTHNRSHKSYRPFTVLTFRWNVWIAGGTHPFGFHLTNIFLHGIVSALVVPVSNNLFGGKAPRMSLLTSLLFAVHPVHTEAVAGVVGRADLLCAFFSFLSFLAYVQSIKTSAVSTLRSLVFLACCIFLCCLALLSKEQGITILGICLAYDIIVFHKINIYNLPLVIFKTIVKIILNLYYGKLMQSNLFGTSSEGENHTVWKKTLFIRTLVMTFTSLLLLYIRWQIMGSKPPIFQLVDNPASFAENFWTRVWTYNYLYSLNAWLLLCPEWLCFDWSMGCVPLIHHVSDLRIVAVVIFWVAMFSLLWRGLNSANNRIGRTVNIAVAVTIIPFVPATNLFFRVGFVLAERVLYMPSLGFCLLIVLGMQGILTRKQKFKRAIIIMFTCLLLLFCMRSIQRSYEWLEENTLFKSALHVCPLNAKVHYNVAKNAGDMGDLKTAIREYEIALKLHPEYDQAMNNMANILRDEGDLSRAETLLRKALIIRPDFAAAWMNLGIVLAGTKQHKEAEICYSTAMTYRSHYPECLYNLGNLYLDLKNYEKALEVFRQAVIQRPSFSIAWNNMVIMLESRGNVKAALMVAKEALTVLPDDAGLHFNMANAQGKMNLFSEAEENFKRAIELAPKNAIYHSNMGVLYHRWKKYDLAELKYRDALSLDPHLTSTKNNLAMLKKYVSKY